MAITLLGTYLVERFDGGIENITRVTIPCGSKVDADESVTSNRLLRGQERESKHARKMIASYEKWFEDE